MHVLHPYLVFISHQVNLGETFCFHVFISSLQVRMPHMPHMPYMPHMPHMPHMAYMPYMPRRHMCHGATHATAQRSALYMLACLDNSHPCNAVHPHQLVS